MLDIMAKIHSINDGVLTNRSTLDCLFICEYVDTDIVEGNNWHQMMLVKYPKNIGIINGKLNFTYQHDDFEPTNRELEELCRRLTIRYEE
jgi:hypothetical protein